MFKNASTFPTSTLKCLLENTELADLLFKNFPLTDDDDPLKSDKQLLSTELGSKVAWNSSAFLGPNLWEKDQLYSATGPSGLQHDKLLSGGSSSSTTTTTSASILSTTNSSSSSSSSSSTTATTTTTTNNNGSNANFKVENIDIDEFLCENNLNLNDIDSFSNQFEHVEQTRSNSPNGNCDPLLLHSPMQAAPAKSPMDDSISHQSSSSSRKYSQDEGSTKTGHSRQSKKARKAAAAAANLAKQFVPDEMKDEKYWARRRKNNLAAKRSRDARRMKENQIALRADFLERESEQLRKQMEDLKRENQKLKMKLIQYESSMKQ